jgi:hypothetical protein
MTHTKTEIKPKPTTDETAREVAVSDDQDIPLPDPVFFVFAMYLADLVKACTEMSSKDRQDEPLRS